jgi:hypothetical protein
MSTNRTSELLLISIIFLCSGCAFIPIRSEYRPGKLLEIKPIGALEEKKYHMLDVKEIADSCILVQLKAQIFLYSQKAQYIYEKTKWYEYEKYDPAKELYEIPMGIILLPLCPILIISGEGPDFIGCLNPFRNAATMQYLSAPWRPFLKRIPIRETYFKGPYSCPGEIILKEGTAEKYVRTESIKHFTITFYIDNFKEKKKFRADRKGEIIIDLTSWLARLSKGETLHYKVETILGKKTLSASFSLTK